jgi:hypothetical protein
VIDVSKLGFARSMFSESDGTASSTRVCVAVIIAFIVGSGVTLIAKLHTPVVVDDINKFLSSAGTFIMTTCTPLYGINKGADVMNKKTAAIVTGAPNGQ